MGFLITAFAAPFNRLLLSANLERIQKSDFFFEGKAAHHGGKANADQENVEKFGHIDLLLCHIIMLTYLNSNIGGIIEEGNDAN